MNLSSPVTSLVPSLDGAVLEVLAGTEAPLGASQIQRLARRGARSGVHRVLDRLVEHGLVTATPTNVGHVYRLNREHVLADAILSAVGARTEFQQRLADACVALTPPVASAALFGSTARRESDPNSDVDLVLVVSGEDSLTDAWDEQIRRLEDQVMVWTGNRLECLVLTVAHVGNLVATHEPIVASLQQDALTLAGAQLPTLLRASSAGEER